MWPRKQLDIEWSDFAFALAHLVPTAGRSPGIVPHEWMLAGESLVTLSVRSGLDLLLQALALPAGSEVLVTEVTIPGMAQILKHHGLVPVPVPVEPARLEPAIEDLERAATRRTRAVLVAHLFGSRVEMEPIDAWSRRRGLFVIEDCAQAFAGNAYAGSAASDCAMFSFGPIKTATALGGAVLRVRDPKLRSRMIEFERGYARQRREAFARRIVKFLAIKCSSQPMTFGALARIATALGGDFDRVLSSAAHFFPAERLLTSIRRRPCAALEALLRRRLLLFDARDAERLRLRTERGRYLAQRLGTNFVVGAANPTHSYWVLPLRVANPREVIDALRRAGYDATRRSSLVALSREAGGTSGEKHWLDEVVFVPDGDRMPECAWQTMVDLLVAVAQPVPAAPACPAVAPRAQTLAP